VDQKNRFIGCVVVSTFVCSAIAAVSADEAKQLNGPLLTAWGAERAGNKEGTIPQYIGDGVKAPPEYDLKNPGQRPDPWHEKPLFSINAQNAAQYADKLDGMVQVFKRYPSFRMDVYPTHRTQKLPKFVLDNTFKNATACTTVDNGNVLKGCYGGFPFPIPKTGAEVMWDHLAAFEARAWAWVTGAWIVTSTGGQVLQSAQYAFQSSPFFDPNRTSPAVGKDVYWRIRLDYTGPARRIGEKLVVIDALDQLNNPRRAYSYIPGQRRVKLAPDLAYDTPSPTGAGVLVMDEGKGFLGALDRYDWKLIGKKEKFIMYNNFAMSDAKGGCTDEKLLTKNFANPDCVRWELHRVWAVEGNLKPGYRHVYKRRVIYWDEDSFQGGGAENYDASGALFRISNQVVVPFFDNYGLSGDGGLSYDLLTGQVALQGGLGRAGWGWAIVPEKDDLYYSPEALAAEGVR
jgi:hypothetical protein